MYDIVIIGAGVVGLSTAMYSGRLNLKTLVLGHSSGAELPIGGTITLTEVVENYPGFIKLSGLELAKNIEKHAREYSEFVEIKQEKAIDVKKQGKGFAVVTEKGVYEGKTLVFATGAKVRKLPAKGSEKLENQGVSYCALCDGPLMRGKVVGVVGGSDAAAKEALLLSEYAKKVYIIYRGEKIRPEPINAKRVEQNEKIEVINNTNITELIGKEKLEKVILDNPYKGSKELHLDAVFVAIGRVPLSELAKKLGVKTNKKGEIIINRNSETNIPGVFAAGDITDTEFKQAITGVGEGVHAAHSAYKYISENFVSTFGNEE